MATGLVKGFWTFLNTDVRQLPWGELTKTGAEAAKATLEAGKAFQEQAPKLQDLAPIAKDVEPFLKTLDSPIVQLAGAGLPFVSIAVTLAKVYLEHSKQEPTLTDSVVLVGQIAYLASLEDVLSTSAQVEAALGKTSLKKVVERQIKRLDTTTLTETQAKKAQVCFHDSDMAQAFNQALLEELQEAGLDTTESQNFVDRVAWNTHRFLHQALAEAADKVKPLAELYRTGGQQVLEKYDSLDNYLRDCISPDSTVPELRDRWRVFNEAFTLKDIYVPPQARLLDSNGNPITRQEPVDLESWAAARLDNEQEKGKVLFIQGDPGRGKSAFCRMFADWVRQQRHPRWTPILIRLRDVGSLDKDFEETLRKAVDRDFTRSDAGWLTDRNTRFLFLLDGFDELLMEGRTTGGLEDFLAQVGKFQRSCSENREKGHRVLITGRTLSLQSIERRMPDNLERLEMLPLDKPLQKQWIVNWSKLVQVDATRLQAMLHDVRFPDQVRELAREPLLLYLLAAMHRDGELRLDMFEGAAGTKAKVLIYEQTINWVLTKQRSEALNRDLTELDTESLRRILAEAGLCVVQSGRECTAIALIEARLQSHSGATAFLEEARKRIQDNPLRNALAAFYLQPGSSGAGSVEFIHKSFGEFLCAERLKEALEDWSKLGDPRRGGVLVPDDMMDWEIYDLLGYGGLTLEIVEYLMALLTASQEIDQAGWLRLFQRLNSFYDRWCEGSFIDAAPPKENLPQKKMCLLKEQLPDREPQMGLRQVDVFTGLNSLILLLELHRYAQAQPELQDDVMFYSNWQVTKGDQPSAPDRLLRVVHYSNCISLGVFTSTLRYFLSNADFRGADLNSANFSGTNFSGTNLSGANLSNVNLSGANLSNANLSGANLSGANLSNANLSNADFSGATLSGANLSGADFNSATLSGVTLSNANLSNADFNFANLSNATLSGADFNSANLRNATLSGADFNSATLSGANLSNANLSGANLSGANLDNISWGKGTIWNKLQGLHTVRNMPAELKQKLGLG